jgi:lysophospholipase L1-like esterase
MSAPERANIPQARAVYRCTMMTPLVRIAAAVLLAGTAALAHASTLPREIRVALVGDSLAYGTGDESNRGIAGRLATEMSSRGVASTSAANFGVNGATTRDVMTILRDPAARKEIAAAHAVVLSAGANDIRFPITRDQPLRSPFLIVDEILRNLDTVVDEIRSINPQARILILGIYAPVAHRSAASLFEPVAALWDTALELRYGSDPLVAVVRMSDIVDRPERLSTIDSFHPGGEAYQEASRRIAELLTGAGE